MFRDGGNNFRSAITDGERFIECQMGAMLPSGTADGCRSPQFRFQLPAARSDPRFLFVALQREAKTFQFGTPWNPIANQRFRKKA
jgi:hypothetical protein